ncbi:chloride transporter [Cellulomonas bogoriensis 69B4 = DSM 16987]|uniref:Chloride transporter n=1 Tax=Cellulomonas bogoriensis 69B4 = DSM 16987 TaxID=1386082 RepID=A0A0A0C0K9_9CELL|nr:chloride transporter [Cellulomonas bogoriensis 69B4 = DSM 16987]
MRTGSAAFGGRAMEHVVDAVDLCAEPGALAAGGRWAVVGGFEGPVRAWRFSGTGSPQADDPGCPWPGVADRWVSSMTREQYVDGVASVREHIRQGRVYQVNLCRVMDVPLRYPPGQEPPARALARLLAAGNPAPYQGYVHVPSGAVAPDGTPIPPVWVVTASPELFLRVRDGVVSSGPIKGTAPDAAGLTEKDRAENIMIADMVRNDLQRVCRPGTVEVSRLLQVEHHPGLVHLVTEVRGELRDDLGADLWPRLLRAAYPPASVSGAPKSSALEVIAELETAPRGPYCGAVGWIDADAGEAEVAVGIRTFWWSDAGGGTLAFGTGAGITWDSDPEREWAETELKAARLTRLACATEEDGVDV